jgi:poly(3-hydroxybutyrate) depolymerase
MKEDGRNRCYYSYVPDCAQGPSPVVFDLHGLGACPTRLGYLNDWMSKADQECIIIVYPVVRLT